MSHTRLLLDLSHCASKPPETRWQCRNPSNSDWNVHPLPADSDQHQKYDERDPEKLLKSNRDVIVKLAELAFKQLMKGNVMFYEEDLIESGLDVADASVYSGICTEIFKEESVIHQRKIYCFIHLSFQEFLAAFFVFYSHVVEKEESLKPLLSKRYHWYSRTKSLYELQEAAVDNSLQSKNGQLDLFLRFLLGVSMESNQRLLQNLLIHTVNSSESIKKTTQYIKDKVKGDECLLADRCINLFLCWKWRIRLCTEIFRSLWNQFITQWINSLRLTAQQ